MITVVHIITALGSGGAERVLYLVASGRTDKCALRHIVVSLTDEGVYGPKLRAAGVELECLGMQRGRSPVTAFVALVRLLRRLRPDVVMTWLYHADLMGTLAARLAGSRRIIWNIRCSDMDFARYAPTTRRIVKVLAWLSSGAVGRRGQQRGRTPRSCGPRLPAQAMGLFAERIRHGPVDAGRGRPRQRAR